MALQHVEGLRKGLRRAKHLYCTLLDMLHVAAFTGGRQVPSARLRIRQYAPLLECHDIVLHEYRSPLGTYPPKGHTLRVPWGVGSLAARIPQIVQSHQCDVTVLQREMLSTFVTLESLTRRPRIFDIDDAIWIYRGGHFARRLAALSDGVICGNTFLADWFSKLNANVVILPTA